MPRGAESGVARPPGPALGLGPAASHGQSGRFVLRATRLGTDVAGWEGFVLVTVEGPEDRPPDPETLRAQFGLTPQQARVALLLAERRSTAEIAEALFVSVHAVRRHVEQVLAKLGVARREDVEAAVRKGEGACVVRGVGHGS